MWIKNISFEIRRLFDAAQEDGLSKWHDITINRRESGHLISKYEITKMKYNRHREKISFYF